tara:strand:+ start:23 stop:1006 length:984 start_codon:yes stop_codon:yes gene_type:complete
LEDKVAALLEVKNLRTHFYTIEGEVKAVDGVSYDLQPGEILGLVGESGCGKSVSAMSVMRLIPWPPGKILDGEVWFDGVDLLQLEEEEMRKIRGKEIGMVFQEPMTSLNPVLTIGKQLTETMELHLGLNSEEATNRAIELLEMVGIPDAASRLPQYPHQFSGGMRQRVMIAMAMSCNPRLIIADEPTTALDVTIQAQILDLMQDLCRQNGVALIVITHNLGVVARYADRVNVMYAGNVVERGSAQEIYHNPHHPYTKGLLNSVPRLDDTIKKKLDPILGLPPSLSKPCLCQFCGSPQPELVEVSKDHLAARCSDDPNCEGWFPRDLG